MDIRKRAYQHLWNSINWQNFMIVITSTDRFGHFLWNSYSDSKNKLHSRALHFFQKVDEFIGDIKNKLKEHDTFIILSDHGMEDTKQVMNLNTYLEQEGFLKLSDTHKNYNRVKEGTKAFVLDPGRVYINKKGIFPNGSVSKSEEKDVIEELKILFYDLKFKNQRVIKNIYEKNEIYSGVSIERAPDLVVLENSGFQPKGGIGKKEIFEKSILPGMHNDSAFLFMNKIVELNEVKVQDVVRFLEGY